MTSASRTSISADRTMVAPCIELSVDDLTAGYGGTVVVHDLSFAVRRGERLGILGRNGAGKTTTLAAIMGLAERQRGAVRLDGEDVSRLEPYQRARRGLGFVPQTRDIFPSLTVEENLISGLNGRPRSSLEQAYRMFPRLKERVRNMGNQLSGGEQQMLSLARALMGGPTILLLDEPLEGLAPIVAEELMESIRQLAEETGVGCILIEQHVDVVLDFATSVVVLERGVPVFVGPSVTLRERPDILERAIGLKKTDGETTPTAGLMH